MSNLPMKLQSTQTLTVSQRWEAAEFFGFETRNKYQVRSENGEVIAFAAEQQKGAFGFLLRQFLGHWRTFEIHLYDSERREVAVALHPFRWFFGRLEVRDAAGNYMGALQQRWAFFSKVFDVEDAMRRPIMRVASPLWKPWTFPFERNGREVAVIRKRWAGLLTEAISDKDRFQVQLTPEVRSEERLLLLAAAIFIDLRYFEKKQ